MIVTAWNNGTQSKTGAGFGLKISIGDRQKFFSKKWQIIDLFLPGADEAISLNVGKKSFWNETCRELISREIGIWLLANQYAPWPGGRPPKFELLHVESNIFRLVD